MQHQSDSGHVYAGIGTAAATPKQEAPVGAHNMRVAWGPKPQESTALKLAKQELGGKSLSLVKCVAPTHQAEGMPELCCTTASCASQAYISSNANEL